MEVTLFIFFDILFINNASLSDSILISKTLFLIANLNSLSVFPTPEKTIFFGLILAFNAFNNSPSDTTSAPDPNLPNSVKIETFELDLTEKQTRGLNFLKQL